MIQLPVLDAIAFDSSGKALPFSWPESIQGAEPFSLAPLMNWLLENHATTSDAMRILKSPNYKPWAEEPTTQQNEAVVQIASDIHAFLVQLTTTSTLEDRSKSLVPTPQRLFQIVPTEQLRGAIEHWLTSDFNASESVKQTWIDDESNGTALEKKSNTAPGWYRDDTQFRIGYRGTGHADAVLKFLCEMAIDKDTPATLRETLSGLTPIAGCLQCHQPSDDSKQILEFRT